MSYKYYVTNNKPDDYGNCKTELVYTTNKNAKQYYHHVQVKDEAEARILEKYLGLVTNTEELQRTDGERFYGTE